MADDLDKLRDSLSNYKKALEEEFDAVEAGDVDKLHDVVKKKFAAQMLAFADEITALAKYADSEQTKLSAIKFAFEFYFGKEASKESGFNALMDKLLSGPQE